MNQKVGAMSILVEIAAGQFVRVMICFMCPSWGSESVSMVAARVSSVWERVGCVIT